MSGGISRVGRVFIAKSTCEQEAVCLETEAIKPKSCSSKRQNHFFHPLTEGIVFKHNKIDSFPQRFGFKFSASGNVPVVFSSVMSIHVCTYMYRMQ